MARWLVTDGDRQFSARDLDELKDLAKRGEVRPGSMVQPPGASDWLYATEIPELGGAFRGSATATLDDDDLLPRRGAGLGKLLVPALALVAGVGGFLFYHYAVRIPDVADLTILGGEHGLELTEMLVTEAGAPLRREPDGRAASLTNLEKDERIQLIAKRGPWYEVQRDSGARGWVEVDDVIPAYFFADKRERENFDPIYNPDRYLTVVNSRWLQLPAEDGNPQSNVTVFQFALKNDSKFEMNDIRLQATIKDRGGRVLEQREIVLEGRVPPWEDTVVGTMNPADGEPEAAARKMTYASFSDLATQDEDLWLRWSDGVEVQTSTALDPGIAADIVLLQARAEPVTQKSRKR